MLWDLLRALAAATLVGVAPGYPWAACLCSTADRVERFAYGVGLSIMLVPAVALLQASIFGTGLSLAIAISSVVIVFGGGVAAYLRFGSAKRSSETLAPVSIPLDLPTLLLLAAALALALGSISHLILAQWAGPLILLLALSAGIARLVGPVKGAVGEPEPNGETDSELRETSTVSVVRYALTAAAFVFVVLRGYLGPLLHDWPYIRGVDGYEHAVMTEMTISTGTTESFMLYPPGFHYLMAALVQFSGMEPLEIFPVLAPMLLPLAALACYAVARRMWGWEAGVAAAMFAGLISYGPYMQFAEGRYPNMLTVHFLLVLAIGALIGLYAKPSVRSGLLLALLGSSVVLYHQIATLYELVLFGLATLCFLPYLLLREPRRGFAMLYSFGLLGVLAVAFAWDTYDLPQAVAGLLGGAKEGKGSQALLMALGSQTPPDLTHMLAMTTQPVMWLGVLGVVLLVAQGSRANTPYSLGRALLIIWGLLLFIGSRTKASGFPERFERDLSIPLALFAAFALIQLLSALKPRMTATLFAASLAALLAVSATGVQAYRNLEVASGPASQLPPKLITLATQRMLTPQIVAAGEWLEEHNTGGNIVAQPYIDLIPSRGILALGGYTGMQSYDPGRIQLARDLPPFGAKPLKDALFVLEHPKDDDRAREIIDKYDVRYVALYRRQEPENETDYRDFESSPLYEKVFENGTVVIFEPRETPR